jgi:hypothetical protein
MQGGAGGGSFKQWAGVSPGQLKQEIEAAFSGCRPGQYYALIVECTNPISGYKVVKIPIEASTGAPGSG